MKYLYSFLFLLLGIFTSINGQEKLVQNVYHRETTSLNGMWKYIVDPYENGFYNYRYEPFENQKNPGKSAFFKNAKQENKTDLLEYNFDKSDSIAIPSDWNSQKEKLFYYEGTVWFKKSFDYKISKENNRVFVYFGASNYETHVYFNGKKLGKHIGGFTPFNFEITHLLKEKDNFLVIKVDNKRKKEGVPTLNTDWWNYGGITRDVKLFETASTFINDYFIQLDKNDKNVINGKIQLNGNVTSSREIQIKIPELNINKKVKTDTTGVAFFNISSTKIKYWSDKNPYLYNIFLQLNNDVVTDKIGFRTIKTSGSSILLNDKKVYLKGISIHEESPFSGGRAHTKEDAKKLLSWAKELGCNYVRLAHYPHNEHMVRLADEMGILVWEENPVYWTISWKNNATYNNAKNQLAEVISRDKNRASVIIWSMANETPTSAARNTFLTNLTDFTRKEDPTRLISAALEQSDYKNSKTIRTINDEFADVVDVLSFNQYIGWYDGLPEKTERITWKITQNKPVLISEFGAGAKKGFYANKDIRWSEEFQEEVYKKTLKMMDKIEPLQGFSPWILVDFKSPRRVLPEIQDNFNRKGLISEKGEKKKAFFVLQNFYNSKE